MWEGKGRAIKEKNIVFSTLFFPDSEVPTAIKQEGGGDLGLIGTAIKNKTKIAASLRYTVL